MTVKKKDHILASGMSIPEMINAGKKMGIIFTDEELRAAEQHSIELGMHQRAAFILNKLVRTASVKLDETSDEPKIVEVHEDKPPTEG